MSLESKASVLAIPGSAAREHRSERRYLQQLPIEVAGFDNAGRFFVEQVTTVDVSVSGCKFQLRTPLKTGSMIAIRMLADQHGPAAIRRTFLFRVAHVHRKGVGWAVGVWRPQPNKPWCTDFAGAKEPSLGDS
ncbi:MAG TPA: PilZ domain-containing protein [Candidatus Acidoferrum sp.]|nr:PilZ domain-containing protein [Candidatus Acidoferrum sp.]